MSKRYEILAHTADIGIRTFGRTLPELYENAARGLLDLLLSPRGVRAKEKETVTVAGADAVDLMIVWLHEVLLRVDARKRAFADVRVTEVSDTRLVAELAGEPFDLSRHKRRREIKGVTYHAAVVEKTESGWMAEVLFDV